jgi:hypothetical protein
MLQGLGTNKAVNSSLIWLLVFPFLTRIVDSLEPRIGVILDIPFNFIMLYFAAFFFTVASVLFQVFCPRLVKLAPTFGTFVAEKHSDLDLKKWFSELVTSRRLGGTDAKLVFQFLSLIKGNDNASAQQTTELISGTAGHAILDPFWGTPAGDKLSYAYDFAQGIAEKRCDWARFFASVCYILGFACLALIFIHNIASVVQYMGNHKSWWRFDS